jgi:transposase
LLDWARNLGEVEAFGVEGCGCYGAGLARFLGTQGQLVLEVNRPDRQARRRRGKSDPVDAEAAARAVLAGQVTAIPKTGSHLVEMVRCLRVARATAVKAHSQAVNALRALVVTAPPELRELPASRLVSTAARLQPGPILTTMAATKLALRLLGERCEALDTELARLDAELDRLTAQAAPQLRQLCGVGPEIAGALLVAAGDNPLRLRSEAAFSMLCGASPIPASSGKTVRHRLNRGGNRQANTALYRIVVVRLRWHQPPATTWPGGPDKDCQAGNHPLPEALCGPRGLRRLTRTRCPSRRHLTIYKSVTGSAARRSEHLG